jgi:hypothetical protein
VAGQRLIIGRRRSRRGAGAGLERIDGPALASLLDGLDRDGELGSRLDERAQAVMAGLQSLSELTAPLAVDYMDRIRRPLADLSPADGVATVTAGYSAHLAVEADPAAFGAADVPVLGTLPPPRDGRPPTDLLLRVVKASRKPFPAIRAVSGPAWEGFTACVTRRVHDRQAAAGAALFLDPAVVDGLLRFGWVLRQVDIHYGLEPERGG